jgi:hypothetical protein
MSKLTAIYIFKVGKEGRLRAWTKEVKYTNPSMSSSLVILFGAVKQFSRFRIWSETECKTPAEYGPHSTVHFNLRVKNK